MLIEMSLQELLLFDPGFAKYLPVVLDLTDPNYIVRIDTVTNAFEVGYRSDKEWKLK